MNRSALILSCALHGSVLALVGWSSLWVMPRLDYHQAEVSVSFSPGDKALVSEDAAPSTPKPEIADVPAETSFTPPPPVIEAPPVPAPPVETTTPVISTTSDMPSKMPALAPAKRTRTPRTASTSAHRVAGGGSATGVVNASGGGGSGYVPPQYLLRYKPPYPEEARAQRLEGVVLVLVGVDAEGRVTSASVRQGCGHAMLDHAALEAVRSWRFTPGRQDGRAIPATVEVPIRFNFSA